MTDLPLYDDVFLLAIKEYESKGQFVKCAQLYKNKDKAIAFSYLRMAFLKEHEQNNYKEAAKICEITHKLEDQEHPCQICMNLWSKAAQESEKEHCFYWAYEMYERIQDQKNALRCLSIYIDNLEKNEMYRWAAQYSLEYFPERATQLWLKYAEQQKTMHNYKDVILAYKSCQKLDDLKRYLEALIMENIKNPVTCLKIYDLYKEEFLMCN